MVKSHKLTCETCVGVVGKHHFSRLERRHLSCIEKVCFALCLLVDGHEEPASKTHTVAMYDPITQQSCDGSVHSSTASLKNISAKS